MENKIINRIEIKREDLQKIPTPPIKEIPNFPFVSAEIIYLEKSKAIQSFFIERDETKIHISSRFVNVFVPVNVITVTNGSVEIQENKDHTITGVFTACGVKQDINNLKVITSKELSKTLLREKIIKYTTSCLVCAFFLYTYINTIYLPEPELEIKAINNLHKKKSKSQKKKAVYVSTRKYKLTGLEEKRKRKSKVVYSVAEWSTRGHYRHLSNGKTIWIKPHTNKRKNLSDKKNITVQNYKRYVVKP